ncbi:MAG: Crp/Fnr family transcriptional regulator [Bacteroidales bacterium]|nr:Crp/Fnr family transcriptional regulator [Bacteroidales bacterium]MCF8386757.1 Crp/Fnr family transcriptional regulator [Bacteroidales bacterium]MCF8398974.1 Crp/Fnr family transcriptional regulator [Bacteroidales bacterium]
MDRSIPVSVLSEKELEIFCNNSVKIFFQKGERIIKQGTFSSNITFIKSGIFKMHINGPLNRDEILKIGKGPAFIGIPDVFVSRTHNYSVSALTNTDACFIDFEGFSYLIENNGQFATEILKTLSYDLLDHFSRCVHKTQKQLTAFLAEALLFFMDTIYESDEFEIPLTRSEFGAYIGTTRETITKIIHDFTKDKIIEVNGKSILILNKNILQKISNTG